MLNPFPKNNNILLNCRFSSYTKSSNSDLNNIIKNRKKYLSPSLKTFEAFEKPFIIKKGKMQYVWDIHDNKYVDLLGQNLCVSVGHAHPRVCDDVINQLYTLPHNTSMYYNEQSSNYAKELVETLPPHPSGEDWVVHLVNSGSDAVDLATQMVKVYTGRPEIYALTKAYHGLQGYAAGLTAIGKSTQSAYQDMFSGIHHFNSNDVEQLKNHITFATGGKIGGIIIEPLQGYGGIHPLANGFMKDTFETVKKHGGVTISDEVQTGFNRCGESFWGFQMKHNDVIPDIITIGKGMGNGMGILGGVISRRSIAEAFSTKMFFNTYGGNPTACAAGRSVLRVMKDENILENCKNQGDLFIKEITKLCENYPQIYKEIRGQGLFLGLEIAGKTNEDSIKHSIEIHKNLLNYGILLGRGSASGNVFRIQPPMCINDKDVMHIVSSLEDAGNEYIKKYKL
tara:strand:- start:1589 stop:2947 length:1359 start_codon:yes stop_codon:yes gene_type:complete